MNTDISEFVLKTKYGTDKSGTEKEVSDVDKKSSDTNEFFLKKDFNARFTELESKIPSISGLVAAFPLSSVENKIKKFSW